ncbi:hypothetical protein L3X37_15135 [Sabulilitoribacter arenilitoris]|uniref:Uncharacterized protein n=1 Tax=Wocania arenilitoris TaxID=2044858 RepID=A0AAE3JQZ6_9FLAO|nr:hypothetical protein [Wocania arenilitoris]MCF7569680.1 hypothetical protein [Wocania arenilitoris]
MKILKPLIATVLLFSILGNAQKKDYLVLKNNDTIYGEKLIFNRKGTGVKVGKNKTIFPDSLIIGYYDSHYDSPHELVISPLPWDKDKPGKKAFIRRLINGKIKLYYELLNPTPGAYYGFYISKDTSKLKYIADCKNYNIRQRVLIKNKEEIIEILRKFVSDSPKVNVILDTISTKKFDLKEIVEIYNSSYKE